MGNVPGSQWTLTLLPDLLHFFGLYRHLGHRLLGQRPRTMAIANFSAKLSFLCVSVCVCVCVLAIVLHWRNSGDGIKCWVCRSLEDPKCADPFDNTSTPFTDCSTFQEDSSYPVKPSTMCRKLRQKINGEWRYILRAPDWVNQES